MNSESLCPTMRLSSHALAGLLFFVGSAQFLTVLMLAEALAPGYSVSNDAISDLGVGPTGLLFNASIVVVGGFGMIAGYLLHPSHGRRLFTVAILLAGAGAIGVGVFPETIPGPHLVAALTAFVFANVAAILAFPLEGLPLNFVSPVLGVIGLAALALFVSGQYLGSGLGGMERMIVYPPLVWEIGFGGALMAGAAGARTAVTAPS